MTDGEKWLTMRPDVPISVEVAEGIGRVVIAFGHVENELLGTIAFLLGAYGSRVRATLANVGFAGRVDALVSLAWARWQEDAPMKGVNATANRLRQVAALRNRYVHSLYWGTAYVEPPHTPVPDATLLGTQRGTHASLQILGYVTRQSLDEATKQIDDVALELVTLHAELEGFSRAQGDFVDISPEWMRGR